MTTGNRATGEQALTQEIEQTRERLGDTVEQLAAKADIKRAARVKAAELTGRVKSAAARVGPEPVWAAVAAAGAVAVGALAISRRRTR